MRSWFGYSQEEIAAAGQPLVDELESAGHDPKLCLLALTFAIQETLDSEEQDLICVLLDQLQGERAAPRRYEEITDEDDIL